MSIADGFYLWDSDIGIVFDIEDYWNATKGEYQCIVNKASDSDADEPECPLLSDTEDIVSGYAADKEAFLRQFQVTWTRLVTIGYEDGDLTLDTTSTTDTPTTTEESGVNVASMMAAWFVIVVNYIVS